MVIRASLLPCCALILVACGPTHQEVADEYRDRVLEKKAAIMAAAAHLEANDKESLPNCEELLDPSLRGSKIDSAMLDWVLYLDEPDHKVQFPFAIAHELKRALEWSSESNRWRSMRDKRAEEGFRKNFEHTLELQHLALSTAQNLKEPQVVSADSFLPGSVDITSYVIAIEPPSVLCRADFTATTANEVTASSFSKFPDMINANHAVRMSLSSDARNKLGSILRSLQYRTEKP